MSGRTDAEEKSYKDVPIRTRKEAGENNDMQAWRNSREASIECAKYIDKNIGTAYDSRDLENFVAQLDEKFGLDRAMYTVAATIQARDGDGRFTDEVRKRAENYKNAGNDGSAFYSNSHSTKLNRLYEQMIDSEKELNAAPVQKEKLSLYFKHKFLYSSERVELRDDYRGIPATYRYNSSLNECYVDGKGWLNNEEYDAALNSANIDARDFFSRVKRINANYIDDTGMTGQMDMSKTEYVIL